MTTVVKQWMAFNENHQGVWMIAFMVAVSGAFVVSDWMLGMFTFSEYILGAVFIAMVLIGQYRVFPTQWKWLVGIIGFLAIHNFFSYVFNHQFDLKTGLAGMIKIGFYLVVLTGVYNYIRSHSLEQKFLIWNNLFAVLICFIGIYITVALYSDGELPYQFFWEFTRWDIYSYYFNGNPNIIRTRSLFSEPSYLGYYLNTILAMNLFNKVGVNVHYLFSTILIVTIILTFSYSAILVLAVIFLLYILSMKRQLFKWNKQWMIGIGVILVGIFLNWETIDHTLIDRTRQILSGEDASGYQRLVESWQYVNTELPLSGNGIGHTPAVWNVYAYMLSDFGAVVFFLSLVFSIWLLRVNAPIGTVFILANMAKGGYLSSSFWLMVLLVFIYIGLPHPNTSIRWKFNEK